MVTTINILYPYVMIFIILRKRPIFYDYYNILQIICRNNEYQDNEYWNWNYRDYDFE